MDNFTILIIKFLKFGAIGLFNTFVDVGLWKVFVNILSKDKKSIQKISKNTKTNGLNIYVIASIFSYVISLASSYLLNSKFTWQKNLEGDTLFRFVFFSLVTFSFVTAYIAFFTKPALLTWGNKIVNTILLITDKSCGKNKIYQKLITIVDYPLLIKVSSVGVSMVLNFTFYNLFVFA
jgi:putative flippase GtrA